MRFLTKLFWGLILILIVGSCSKNAVAVDLSTRLKTSDLKALSDSDWVFDNYVKNPVTVSYLTEITLSFKKLENEKIICFGKSSKNFYDGNFTVNEGIGLNVVVYVHARLLGHSTNLHNATNTNRSIKSSNKEISAFDEQEFYVNLEKVTFFQIKNNKLYLYAGNTMDDTTEILIFNKNDSPFR